MSAPEPGSLWRHSKSGNPYVVIALAKLEATEEEHVVYQRVDEHDRRAHGPAWATTWIRPLREWEEPTVVPVCVSCGDKHQNDGGRLCTRCPVPCQRCRVDAIGAYCGKTPCACDCHVGDFRYEDHARRKALPAVPRFVRVTP